MRASWSATSDGVETTTAPVSGTVEEVNAEVADKPELVNDAPYAGGWLIKVRPDDPADVDNLLTAEQYADQLAKS